MKKILFTFLVIFSCQIKAQEIVVDENVMVKSTEINFHSNFGNSTVFSSIDNKKVDSLIVNLTGTKLVDYSIKLDFTQKINPTLIVFSDINEFDGKNFMEIELINYELTLNKEKYNFNDKLMGFISGRTEIFLINDQPYFVEFNGHFSHVVGQVLRKKRKSDTYDKYDPR